MLDRARIIQVNAAAIMFYGIGVTEGFRWVGSQGMDEADLDRWFANVDFQVPEDVCEAVHRWAEHYDLSRVDDLSPIDSQFWMDKSTEYRDHAERNMSDDAAA